MEYSPVVFPKKMITKLIMSTSYLSAINTLSIFLVFGSIVQLLQTLAHLDYLTGTEIFGHKELASKIGISLQ